MKERDDTPLPESESECPCSHCKLGGLAELFRAWNRDRTRIQALERLIESHMIRLANLETQRTANESNQDDPEWY